MKFIRYLCVGGCAYAIDLACFLSLIALQIPWLGPLWASVVGKLLSSFFALFSHRYFTFHHTHHLPIAHQAWRYFSLVTINIPCSTLIFLVLLHWIQAPLIAKVMSEMIWVGVSYWLSQELIFKRKRIRPHINNS